MFGRRMTEMARRERQHGGYLTADLEAWGARISDKMNSCTLKKENLKIMLEHRLTLRECCPLERTYPVCESR